MRILHVIPSIAKNRGGPSRSVPSLIRAEREAGAEPQLYALLQPREETSLDPASAPFALRVFPPMWGTQEIPTPLFVKSLSAELRRIDVAWLHGCWNPTTTTAAYVCRSRAVPYILQTHGMLRKAAAQHKRAKKLAYYALFDRHTFRGCSAIACCSELEIEEARHMLNPSRPFVVLPNGIVPPDKSQVEPTRFLRRYPNLTGKRILLFVGRLQECKNLSVQLDAMALLAKRYPDAVWVLVGPDCGEWRKLRRAAARLGLSDRIHWTGALPNDSCLDAMSAADLLLLTSFSEGHSMAMNEALAVGTPLVLTENVGAKAVAEAGAALVTASDPSALADAVARILEDPQRAANMRQAGRRFAELNLPWRAIGERVLAICKAVLGGASLSHFRAFPARSLEISGSLSQPSR
jgi:glycosyltransferase involved in cell wall biosynthesis